MGNDFARPEAPTLVALIDFFRSLFTLTLNFAANFPFAQILQQDTVRELPSLNLEGKYHALVEQIPAVVFMAYLDKGTGKVYVSPRIEAALGFSPSELPEHPLR